MGEKMLKYLEDSDVTKVSTSELKERSTSCALRNRREKRKTKTFLRSPD